MADISPSSGLTQRRPAVRGNASLERLDCLDQDYADPHMNDQDQYRSKPLQPQQPPPAAGNKKHRQHLQRQLQQQQDERKGRSTMFPWLFRPRELDRADLWSWLTSSRTLSLAQFNRELAEERVQWDWLFWRRQQILDPDQAGPEPHRNLAEAAAAAKILDRTEAEKKTAKLFWEAAEEAKAFDMTSRDQFALATLTLISLCVRFWKISWPDEVLVEEAHMGREINSYMKNEFKLGVHPPLGKFILASVAHFAGYDGSFPFAEVGDQYQGSLPYVSMRASMAIMGVMCAPMAYATLKATGHSAPAAILAATFVIFDNALTSNNRLMALDAPLMFFVAAAAMSWSYFSKNSARPFSWPWWKWLLLTGISVTGAMSVKLAGALTFGAIGFMALMDLWALANENSTNVTYWAKHFVARVVALVALPMTIYLALFQIYFGIQTKQPPYREEAQAVLDFLKLSRPYQELLEAKYPKESEPSWSLIVYGSVVQLRSEYESGMFLHSFDQEYPTGSKQQQVGGYERSDPNTYWIVTKAEKKNPNDDDKNAPMLEIPARLEYLKDGDLIRLRHVSTRAFLHSHDVRTSTDSTNKQSMEVSAYGVAGFEGDSNDWWVIEMVTSARGRPLEEGEPNQVKALETAFRLKHKSLSCYLFTFETSLPAPWGKGRREVMCRQEAAVTPKSVWRFTKNYHDFLPADTPRAAYHKPGFMEKFIEIHRLMWLKGGLDDRGDKPSSSKAHHWILAQSLIPQWSGYFRQVAVIGNPAVWWTCFLGIGSFAVATVAFIFRGKRLCHDAGLMREFKNFYTFNTAKFFIGWAIHYLPFFFVKRNLYGHHYFPALYYSILMTSSMSAGLTAFLSRNGRFAFYAIAIFMTVSTFVKLSPFTYGTLISRTKCGNLHPWINSVRNPFDNRLDCSLTHMDPHRLVTVSLLKTQARQEKEVWSRIPENQWESKGAPYSLLRRIRLHKAIVSPVGPVLEKHYPPIDKVLPKQDMALTWRQLPQQLKDFYRKSTSGVVEADPEPGYLLYSEEEEAQLAAQALAKKQQLLQDKLDQEQKLLQQEQEQQQQQQQQQPGVDSQDETIEEIQIGEEAPEGDAESARQVPPPMYFEDVAQDAPPFHFDERELDELLEQYRAQKAEEREQERAAAIEAGELDEKDQAGEHSEPARALPTEGLEFPPNYEGRPGYQEMQQMFERAGVAGSKARGARVQMMTDLGPKRKGKMYATAEVGQSVEEMSAEELFLEQMAAGIEVESVQEREAVEESESGEEMAKREGERDEGYEGGAEDKDASMDVENEVVHNADMRNVEPVQE